MVEADKIVEETKKQYKKFVGEIDGAERLVKLLERSGVPVTEEKIQIQQMKEQASMIKTALKKDKRDYGQ